MKGKILKIRPGYNPNSSSIGFIILYIIVGVVGVSNIIASIVASSFLYKKRKREIEKKEYEEREKAS